MKKRLKKIKSFLFRFFNRINPYYSYQNSNYKNHYYRSQLFKYRDGQFYINLIKRLNVKNEIQTLKPIELIKNKKIDEITSKDIIAKYGKPSLLIIHEELLGINILHYKQKIGNFKTKLEFHFMNKKLFFYAYTFQDIDEKGKLEIKKIIQEKYIKEDTAYSFDNYVIDKNNIIILLNDSIEFEVYYLCDNEIDIEKIKNYINFLKYESKNTKEINRKILYKKL